MKSLLIATAVSLAFAVFFTAFLVVPMLVILVAYYTMIWQAKRRSRRAATQSESGVTGP